MPLRTENLKAQAAVANLLADNADLAAQPWNQLSQMMAEFWISEAENTFTQTTSTANNKERFVAGEELLPTAPSGKWEAALPQGVPERLDATISKTILVGANFDPAADRIVEIGKLNPEAGVALAEDFLTVWAKSHNPQLPEELRRKYELAEDARIPVTPIMMEKNVASLARMMALFRQAGIAPKDYEKVVAAFDVAYSDAEAYRAAHIEKVFGPLEKMDEPLFFLILSRMNTNLAERWRKMDVQKAGLTQRDETQTLEMVRAGYAGALAMINNWLAGHPDGSRALTLDGDPIRAKEGGTTLPLPPAKAKDVTAIYHSYEDMNAVTLSQPSVTIGRSAAAGGVAAEGNSHFRLWLGIGAPLLALAGWIFAFLKHGTGAGDQGTAAANALRMPGEVDGFAIVALLRRLRASPLVKPAEPEQQELQQDIQRGQQSCFGTSAVTMSETDLRSLAEKWLRTAR